MQRLNKLRFFFIKSRKLSDYHYTIFMENREIKVPRKFHVISSSNFRSTFALHRNLLHGPLRAGIEIPAGNNE